MKYRYEEFTWPEIRHAVAGNRVAVLPVGTVEQHGPHLPLVTDVLTATEMSRMAVERAPEKAVLLPPVYYSFNEHHLDFPGTIAVAGETIIRYVTDIGRSLAHHPKNGSQPAALAKRGALPRTFPRRKARKAALRMILQRPP
jgi:creatinine amidohydrolase